jgi:hypothetical protein
MAIQNVTAEGPGQQQEAEVAVPLGEALAPYAERTAARRAGRQAGEGDQSDSIADRIERLRRQYPHVSSGFFEVLEERSRINHELSELRGTIAYLCGRFDVRAEDTGNTDLSTLVGELRLAIGLAVNDGSGA